MYKHMALIEARYLDRREKYFMLLNKEETHGGVKCHSGLNKCNNMCFFSESQLPRYRDHLDFDPGWMRKVTFENLEDTQVCVENGMHKADVFVLGKRYPVGTHIDVFSHIRFDDEYVVLKTNLVSDYYVLRYMPEEYITYDISFAAITKYGWALRYIPEEHKTAKLCDIALAKYGWALEYILEEHRTQKLCQTAVKNYGRALYYVPVKLRTYDLCKIAVMNDGCALKYVPDRFKLCELCLIAVKNDGFAIWYVPTELCGQIKEQMK